MSRNPKISPFWGTFTIMPPKSYLPHEKTKIYINSCLIHLREVFSEDR